MAGSYTGYKQTFPFSNIHNAYKEFKKTLFEPPHFLYPARYEGKGIIVNQKEKTQPGVNLITGIWENKEDSHGYEVGARLYSDEGTLLHKWEVKSPEILQNTQRAPSYIHSSLLFPNGDIILVMEYNTLLKLDKDSNILWKLPIPTHHTLSLDEEGNIWTLKYKELPPTEFSFGKPIGDDVIIKLSPDGQILKEISLYNAIIQSDYAGLLRQRAGDLLHTNNVEVLSKKKADAFPLFNAGDILVSSRTIHTVYVIDQETKKIKWSLTHPFIGQHDPDFTDDGKILVFDNHSDWVDPAAEKKGSRILLIDPVSKEIEVVYGQKEGEHFYTAGGGKLQQLQNGNLLITEARSGRVFEITPEKEIVWDWIAPKWQGGYVSEILEGTRYPEEAANFTKHTE